MHDELVLAVSIPEAAHRLGVSPRTVATLISRNQLTSRKIGRRRVIPVRALEEFLRPTIPRRQKTRRKNEDK